MAGQRGPDRLTCRGWPQLGTAAGTPSGAGEACLAPRKGTKKAPRRLQEGSKKAPRRPHEPRVGLGLFADMARRQLSSSNEMRSLGRFLLAAAAKACVEKRCGSGLGQLGVSGGLSQLALRRLVSAPDHACTGCPKLRPASAIHPPGPRSG